MNKVIITGATGSIGSALIDLLTKNNIKVTAIVRPNSKNISNIKKNQNVKIIEKDLNDLVTLDINDNYDTFFHFGWDGTTGNDRLSIQKQAKNIDITFEALKLAKKVGVKKFVFSGSQAEYGPKNEKIYSTANPTPNTAYGYAKYITGYLGTKLAKQMGMDFLWTRIFSTYGPTDSQNTMIKSTIIKMLNNESIDFTEGKQLWEYIWIEDVAKALYLIAEKGKSDHIYNISGKECFPLKKYIMDMYKLTGSLSKLNFGAIPYTTGIVNLYSDKKELYDLGFEESYNFDKGIRKILEVEARNKNEKNKRVNSHI